MNEVGDLVLSVDGQWMVRPPERCGNGHRITPGPVVVGTAVCRCQDRHLTWECDNRAELRRFATSFNVFA